MTALALVIALLAAVATFVLSALVAQLRAQVTLLEEDAHAHEDIAVPDRAGEESSSPAQRTHAAARTAGDFAAGAALAACIEHLDIDVDSVTGVRVTPSSVEGWADVTVDHDDEDGRPATLRRWLPIGTAARGPADVGLHRAYQAAAVDHDRYGSYRRRDLPTPADPARPYVRGSASLERIEEQLDGVPEVQDLHLQDPRGVGGVVGLDGHALEVARAGVDTSGSRQAELRADVVKARAHVNPPSVGRQPGGTADVVGASGVGAPGAGVPTVGDPTASAPVSSPGVVSVDGPVGGGIPPASSPTVAPSEGRERIPGASREELMTGVLVALDLLEDTATSHPRRAIRRALLDPIEHPERYAL